MANVKKRLSSNVEGEFFVDSTCIDCDACRQLAPATFGDETYTSYVHAQPRTKAQVREALHALLACPSGSIGTLNGNDAKQVMDDFPLRLEDNVYYAGYNSADSYGGNAYFVQHPDGNWLIDAPRYVRHLINRIDELGGLRYIFLTHRDDVADAHRFAERFGAERIIHEHERRAQPDAEIIIDGIDPVAIAPEFLVIPTPGHTRGHCVLLYQDRFLFTGDHLSWNRADDRLRASRRVCWYSWEDQTASMARLQNYAFEWILPGHGQRHKLSKTRMKRLLAELVEGM